MRLRVLTASCILLIAASALAGKPAATTESMKPEATKAAKPAPVASPAAAAFEQLKRLAGTWTWQREGKAEVALQTRVSSGGSVLIETMFPGMPHEMTNVYSLDGDALIVTHYCAAGNQPRLTTRAEKTPGVLQFVLRDATAVDPKTGDYMGELTLALVDADHIVQEWRHFKGGKPSELKRFEFTRQK